MSRRSRGHDDAVAAPRGRFREAGAADSPQPGRGAAAICFRGECPDAGERTDTDAGDAPTPATPHIFCTAPTSATAAWAIRVIPAQSWALTSL